MASEQSFMLQALRAAAVAALALAATLACSGCAKKEKFVRPSAIVSPWGDEERAVIVAVAPLRNESGASVADEIAVSEALAAQLQQTDGLQVLSINRVIATMRSLGMNSVDSAADARRLGAELGADAIIAGSLTSWDPYNPPRIGLSLALFAPANSRLAGATFHTGVDPVALQGAPTDYGLVVHRGVGINDPLAAASLHLDGANDAVRSAIFNYAQGRHDPNTALSWQRYLASMRLFTEFACHTAAAQLLDQERRRRQEHATAQADTGG